MLCTHKTASSASLVIQKFVPTLLTHISPNSRPFLVGIVSLSDGEIQPDPIRFLDKSSISLIPTTTKFNLIRFDQISEHLRTPKQQIGSEQVLQASPRPASTELREFSQSFKVLSQPSNERKIISHSNLSSTTLTLDKHSSTVSTTSTGLEYLTSILWRPASAHPLTTVLSHKSL